MSTPTHLRAVAFDLDGTMFDTEALFFRVASEMLADRGKVFTAEMMAAMIGRPAAISGPALREMAGLAEAVEDLMAEARTRFLAVLDGAVRPAPGLARLLEAVDAAGLPRCVATSSRRDYVRRLLGSHDLLDGFSFLLTAEDVTRGKPDPEIYLSAASRFGVAPAELLVLEDSPAGLTAALSAGAFAVAVPHDHSPHTGLSAAHLIVDGLDDPALLRLLEPLS
jgi:HAD superfamily hydrolase (TIGR01509 family)